MSVFTKQDERSRRRWTSPELRPVGTVGDVLQGGGGKNSPSPADPGEVRKPRGQANEG
jgi:hypothetical protein